MFKQKCFLALKHACNEQRAERSNMKFKAWSSWCETARKQRYFEKKEIMVSRIEGLRTERLLKRVFDGIRYHNISLKFEEAREVLREKIPERDELAVKKEKLLKVADKSAKRHLLRQTYYRFCDHKHRAFMIWRDYCKYYSNVMNRLKLYLISKHKRDALAAFMRLKEASDKNQYVTLLEENETQVNLNQDLVNEIGKKREKKAQQEV